MENKDDRDQYGRYAPGNKGGPGRPRRCVEDDYLATLSDEISIETWRQIVQSAAQAAKQGDHRAREWLSRYLLPTPAKENRALQQITVAELAGLDRIAESVGLAELRKTLMAHMPSQQKGAG